MQISQNLHWPSTPLLVNAQDANPIGGDPHCVDAAERNFRLGEQSDAIDAGQTLGSVTDDFDGVRRPQGTAYDLAAFERPNGNGLTGDCDADGDVDVDAADLTRWEAE